MKKAIVTGGAGFIGSHLVDYLLSEGHKVIVIDNYSTGRPENLKHHKNNTNLELIQADINNKNELKKFFKNANWAFHLAALADIVPSIQHPENYFRSNVNGTFSIVQLAKEANVDRFIYIASSSCYGIPDTYPTPETAEIRTEYPYALTKYLGEQIALHWGNVYNLPVISLRFFNIYGPRSRTSGTYGAVFGVFLSQKIHNMPFTVVGNGTQTRDFTYVTDAVNAIMTAVKSNISSEIFNVGSGDTYSINQLVKLLEGEVIYIPKRPGEPDCTFADITKIQQKLHWNPHVSFKEGVKKMIDNIEYWKDAPIWTPEKIQVATKDWFRYLSNNK